MEKLSKAQERVLNYLKVKKEKYEQYEDFNQFFENEYDWCFKKEEYRKQAEWTWELFQEGKLWTIESSGTLRALERKGYIKIHKDGASGGAYEHDIIEIL